MERKQKLKIGEKIKNMKIFYISDLHIKDQAIFDKCNRPFESLNDFEGAIIKKWNKKVSKDDIVYVLGDIGSSNKESVSFYKCLNGHKHLIIGNHDHEILKEIEESKIFKSINFIKLINDNDRKVCLCHYPLMDWMEFNRNGYLVYGHIHNKTSLNGNAYQQIKEYYKDKPAFNCGCDVTNYEPVTLDEMIKLKEKNKNEPYIN